MLVRRNKRRGGDTAAGCYSDPLESTEDETKTNDAQKMNRWMNKGPESWNIFDELAEGEEGPWHARSESGNIKQYVKIVRPHAFGSCPRSRAGSGRKIDFYLFEAP
jgi:hypothetical protein